jgi:hypothetical protein
METQVKEVAVKANAEKERAIIPRHKANIFLGLKFLKDYKEMIIHFSLEQQIEITEHLMGFIELMEKDLKEQDEANYYEYLKREAVLLKKYGKTFKPFIEKLFCQYFYFEHALVTQGIYTRQQYDEFIPEQKIFSADEVFDYHQICLAGLTYNRNMLYLQREPEFEPQTRETETIGEAEPNNEITKARQLLAIYYLLKAGFDVEHRVSSNVSQIAKFVHLMTGTKFTTLQNSDIYKKYLKMPNFKKDRELIRDLKYIRTYFSDLSLHNVVQMINAEIEKAISELPQHKHPSD